MKKIKFNFWLLGFGCGVIFTGMIGTLVTLNVRAPQNVQQESTLLPEKVQPSESVEHASEIKEQVTNSNEQQTDEQTNNKEETVVVYKKVSIPDNYDAKRICQLLEENEIVEDSAAFLEYIKEQGKQRYLRSGTISLPKGGTHKEILALLVY